MQIRPYLFYGGRADEAIAFYEGALGAKLTRRLRFKDNPEAQASVPAERADKIMHAELQIGKNALLLSDGQDEGGPTFQGFSLTLVVENEAEADRIFAALSEGGAVAHALTKTFFSPRFGMVKDRFGVLWIVLVGPSE